MSPAAAAAAAARPRQTGAPDTKFAFAAGRPNSFRQQRDGGCYTHSRPPPAGESDENLEPASALLLLLLQPQALASGAVASP